jgi:hypothetical protein
LVCCLLLGAGRVETRDARVYTGEVSLDAGSVLVKPEDGGAPVRLGVDQLLSVQLRDTQPRPLLGSEQNQLPSPWMSADVGDVHLPGSAACDVAGTLKIEASGWGAWGGADSFHWVYHPLEGDGQIVAQVRGTDQSHGPLVVALMIRQSLDPGADMAATCLLPGGEVRLNWRTDGRASSSAKGTAADSRQARTWIRLARQGDVFTAYCSADGRSWQRVDRQTVPLGPRVLVGAAAWTTANASRAQAVLERVSIVAGTAGTATSLTETGVTEGVVLRDQSVYAGVVAAADAAGVTLWRGRQKRVISKEKIARIILHPPGHPLDHPTGHTGALLLSGDFLPGELTAITSASSEGVGAAKRMVSISSQLFGPKDFDADAVAVVFLGDLAPASAVYRVQSADGSVFEGDAIQLKKDGISLDNRDIPNVVAITVRPPQ